MTTSLGPLIKYLIPRSTKRRNSGESEGFVQEFPPGHDLFAPQRDLDLEGGRRGIGGLRQSTGAGRLPDG